MLHTQPLCVAERSSDMKMWFEIFVYRVRAVPGGFCRPGEGLPHREPVKPGGLTPMSLILITAIECGESDKPHNDRNPHKISPTLFEK